MDQNIDTQIKPILELKKIKQKKEKKETKEKNKNKVNTLDELKKLNEMETGLNIATMTLTFKVNTILNVENIGKYIRLSDEGIVEVSYKNKIRTTRQVERKVKRRKKKKRVFYNQVTVLVNTKSKNTEISNKKTNKLINVKLFNNGSVQLTGCKNLSNLLECIEVLNNELQKVRGYFDEKESIIKKIIFMENKEAFKIENVSDIKINLINCKFDAEFLIDRKNLHEVLKSENIECELEACVHAAVNIKFMNNGEKISIFVFESGSVIITGAKTKNDITAAYNFMIKKFYENYNKIVKIDPSEVIKEIDIDKFIKEIDDEIENKIEENLSKK
jgi:TATA-box binding protein (TBP) (component of TFIID and TFIIIB)